MTQRTRIVIALVALAAGVRYGVSPDSLRKTGLLGRQSLPNFVFTDQDENVVDRNACEGRPALFYAWGLDQPSSGSDEAVIDWLYKKYGKDRLCFVPIATEVIGAAHVPRVPYIAAHGLRFPVYDEGGHKGWAGPPIQAPYLPYLLISDRRGKVRMTVMPSQAEAASIDALLGSLVFDGSPEAQTSELPPPQPSRERLDEKEFKDKVLQLLKSRAFDDLDKMAEESRAAKARWPGGLWKLASFYEDLAWLEDDDEQAVWDERQALLRQWKQSRPDSVTARSALAYFLVNWAWKGRSAGYGYQLTDEQTKLFSQRLVLAREEAEEALKLPAKCQSVYAVLQRVAKGQSWETGEYEALLSTATAQEPDYFNYYFLRTGYLSPIWYGEPGQAEAYARGAALAAKGRLGLELYARIGRHESANANNMHFAPDRTGFLQSGFSWPLMREGYLDMEKRYPDSELNRNEFAQFACWAGDKETAKALFARIGDKFDAGTWTTRTRYEHWRRWAGTPDGPLDDFKKKWGSWLPRRHAAPGVYDWNAE